MAAFPRQTIAWELERKSLLKRFRLSIAWYGVASGVLVRLYRWGVLVILAPVGLGMVLATIAFGLILICALATGHLANHTIRQWKWRAPMLGAYIAAGECVTSLVLTIVHQERLGRTLATLGDWPSTVLVTLVTRVVIVSVFALVLAGVVTMLRKAEGAVGVTEVVR